jgi:hypothetical protein
MIFVGRLPEEGGLSIIAAGHYEDHFVRTGSGWRFAARKIIFA